MPIEDAQVVFTEEELSTMRKSVDNTEVIVHEETLIRKRNSMGLTTLPSEDTGIIEWTYPVYENNSESLNNLLASNEWAMQDETAETTRKEKEFVL